MIDLHLHTTASDGHLSPADLVARISAAGITIMSVTDHDTFAALDEVRRSAIAAGVRLVDGIEITAVHEGRDVHVLGYFVDTGHRSLARFLERQRSRRVERVREVGHRLTRLGVPIDTDDLLAKAAAQPGESVGRPAIARALVAAGYVRTVQAAFDCYLASGRPAFVPRVGPSPHDVVDMIHTARGIASMAHPGVTNEPEVLASLAKGGLDAVEVFHSDQPPALQHELQGFAARHQLLVTGGSDFHGDDGRDRPLGGVTLPPEDFDRLEAAARTR